ncbi:MAG: SURF1 family protein [Candidatus Nanopelagicales bacterium]
MWSLLRSRRWIAFTALVIVAIVAFGLLSRWQWQRADEERGKREAWAAQAALPAVALDSVLADPVEWTPVSVTGTYDVSSTVLVRQRPLDGRNGFWGATALDTSAGRVWVNRGWIPVTGTATGVVSAPDAPSGPVVVEARVRLAETAPRPVPTDLPSGQVPALDPSALGSDVTSIYLEATASEPADPDVVRMPAPAIDETQNISYALQWLVFAAVAMTGWWFFLRREAREDAQAAVTSESS